MDGPERVRPDEREWSRSEGDSWSHLCREACRARGVAPARRQVRSLPDSTCRPIRSSRVGNRTGSDQGAKHRDEHLRRTTNRNAVCDLHRVGMHEVDLLAYLASWSERNAALTEGKGVTLRFNQSPPGRAKPSAWVTATTSAAEAQLIVWASGELEFAAGSAGSVAPTSTTRSGQPTNSRHCSRGC